MSIAVKFSCGGCDATAWGTKWLAKEFVSFSGRSHGFGPAGGQWVTGVEDVVPEGWVAFDPYTFCCYCPKCWASIIEDTGESVAATEEDTTNALSPATPEPTLEDKP